MSQTMLGQCWIFVFYSFSACWDIQLIFIKLLNLINIIDKTVVVTKKEKKKKTLKKSYT